MGRTRDGHVLAMIPRRPGLDATLALARRGYLFVTDTCDRLGADAFHTRLLGRRVICARGYSAAQAFYAAGRFTRRSAMPVSAAHLLQDAGSVQMLDGAPHHERKDLFVRAVPQGDAGAVLDPFREHWTHAAQRWSGRPRIALLDEVSEVLTRTATQWAGVELPERDVAARSRQLSLMITGAGSVGPRNWWARWSRRRCERWAAHLVRAAREDDSSCPAGSPLALIASHRDGDGRLLPEPVAAVELLNILRPLVAVGRFIVFAAVAMVRHPEWRHAFRHGDESDLVGFVQEVRRLYPFFPLIGGKVLEPFTWSGHEFAAGDWMVLDLYGTNHDPRLWPDPEEFRPQRFRGWKGDASSLIPQGGGEVATGHRCPGENVTIALIAEAVRMLARQMEFTVPPQDLSIDLRRMPARPRDGFVMTVQRADASRAPGPDGSGRAVG